MNHLYEMFDRFGTTKEDAMDVERIIYADFLAGRDVEVRYYTKVPDLDSYVNRMDSF